MRSSTTPTPIALKSPSKPNVRRLIRSATAPRTLLSFNPSSQVVRPDGKHGPSVIDRLHGVKPHSLDLLQLGDGLGDAAEADVAAEDDHGFEEGWCVFAAADGDPYGLEHGAGLEAEL